METAIRSISALGGLLAVLAFPSAATAASCDSFSFRHNGVPWRAEAIRVTNTSCAVAERIIRSFAKPRNCRFVKTCTILDYRCRTTFSSGSRFRERCTRGTRVVRWNGSYRSS